MPLYALRCRIQTCGHTFEEHAPASMRFLIPCPKCKTEGCETNFDPATGGGGPKIERTWHGKEAVSGSLVFDPAGIHELKKEVPDAELDERGHMTFRNDRHHRRCLKQIDAARQQYQQEALDKAAQAAEAGDLEVEAAALEIAANFEKD